MKSHGEAIKKRYDRIAPVYDLLERPMETRISSWRAELLAATTGKVLEIGAGTGKNLPHYPPEVSVTAIDFSAAMLGRAREKVQKYGLGNVTLLEMDVQDLGFMENSFDCVVTTCVFCSVPVPVQGLREIRRVCKPDGKVLMLEHVRSAGRV